MKKRLIVSTGNKNKIKEIEYLLKDLDLEILSKSGVGYADLEVIEDGNTLKENSYKKAKSLADKVDDMVIADDSGLFVDYLDGRPGVHSSRYGGEDGNDEKNNSRLLKELEGVEDRYRRGRFKTVITLITEDKEVYEIEGICEGRIIHELRGDNGFGYDPLFIPEGYEETFGELSDDVKNKLSHRYKALVKLRNKLKRIL